MHPVPEPAFRRTPRWELWRKLAASALVLAATAGPMAVATFGRFEDDAHAATTSVLGP